MMKTNIKVGLASFILLAFLAGCGEETTDTLPPTPPDPTVIPGKLVSYQVCDDLFGKIKEPSARQITDILSGYETCDYYCDGDSCPVAEEAMGDPVAAPTSADNRSDPSFTPTNLQEKNVDENDQIKTDGHYIYVAIPGGVDIFKAWPLADFNKVFSYRHQRDENIFDWAPSPSLHLAGDKLILITSENKSTRVQTRIEILDTSNPEFKLVRQKEIEGTFNSSRVVDNILHLVVSDCFTGVERFSKIQDILAELINTRNKICSYGEGNIAPLLSAMRSLTPLPSERTNEKQTVDLKEMVAKARDQIKQALSEATIEDWLPKHGDGIQIQPVECKNIYLDDTAGVQNFIGFTSLDLNDKGHEKISYVKGNPYHIYASTRSFYLASSGSNNTTIHRFAVQPQDELHEYVGSGAVEGFVNNSFSMGEWKNTFQIATSTELRSNNVYVLDVTKAELPVIGKIENLAPGEFIYAVRYLGNKGYVVTFKKIDPLFVINFENPTDPFVEGELKMPGYSSYLHPLGENHLIGLGKDAEDQGSFAWFQGLKLALFDVEDGRNPKIVDEEIIGSRGSDSMALYNHHAFTFDEKAGLLALPVTITTGGLGGNDYGAFAYNGVHLYSIDSKNGIKSEGVFKLPGTDSYNHQPLRTLIISDQGSKALYVLDNQNLYQVDINDLSRASAFQTLTEPLSNGWYNL